MPMIDTAEIVAQRYQITRETQDAYALESQKRTAAAQAAGRFDDEIVPFETRMGTADKATGEVTFKQTTLKKDEGNRPETTAEGLASLKPVRGEGHVITAGNASQLSDGASACVVMEAAEASRRGLTPLGALRGLAVAGCEPDEMGIGPVFAGAAPAGAQQPVGGRHRFVGAERGVRRAGDLLPRPSGHRSAAKLNVDGGAISIGHPYGMSGAAYGRPPADRRPTPEGEVGRRYHVRRWRHGCGRPLRNLLGKKFFVSFKKEVLF